MKTTTTEFTLNTEHKHEVVNVTAEVQKVLADSGIKHGLCTVQSLHTTAAVYVNVTEDLQGDVLSLLERLAPQDGSYRHNAVDPNAEAHLKKILTGRSATIVVKNGQLVLGTWEKIQFAEFDGPRQRKVFVHVIGD